MKTSTQLNAKIRNLSNRLNIEHEVLLRNFMMERFLERISVSNIRNNFILKGGMLIASVVGIDTRNTMDMDVSIINNPVTESEVVSLINDIINTRIDDKVEFSYKSIEEIREESEYYGFRVSISAAFDKIRHTIKVDISTGDTITPKEIEYSYKLMFEDRNINILAYNLETILAEKYETIIARGVLNTRMRDFYDIYILTTLFSYNIDTFNTALQNTATQRGTAGQLIESKNILTTVAGSQVMINLWFAYQRKYSFAADITWDMAIAAVNKLTI